MRHHSLVCRCGLAQLFWAACAKTLKRKKANKKEKAEDSSPGLAAKSEETLGKTTSFRKRQDHRVGRSLLRLSLHLWPIRSCETSALSI